MTASLVTRRALLLTLSNRKNSSGRSAEKCHATYTKRTPPASAGKRMRATKTKAGQWFGKPDRKGWHVGEGHRGGYSMGIQVKSLLQEEGMAFYQCIVGT